MNNASLDIKIRLAAAMKLAQLQADAASAGKKDQAADAAQRAATGRFAAPVTPPRLVVSR